MRTFLKRIFFFLLFSAALYILLIILFGSFAPGYLNKNLNYKLGAYGQLYSRLKDADTTKNVDILFLGSSHSYRGYDPRIFRANGYKIFVLGSSAQTPIQTEVLLDRYMYKMNPRLVVLDVYPALFGNEGIESALDMIANAKMEADIVKMTFKINNIKVYNTFLYGMFRHLFSLNKNFREKSISGGDSYIKGGYVETFRKYKSKQNFIQTGVIDNKDQWDAFQRIIAKLKAGNKSYLLIQSPMTKRRYNSFTTNATMDSLFTRMGSYYNFNEMLSLPDSVFFDDSHLNQFGVNLYNRSILRIVSKGNEAQRVE